MTREVRAGDGLAEIVVGDVGRNVFFRDLLDLVYAVESFEGGVHEVGEGRELTVVDAVLGEGEGGGVEVFHD